MTAWIGAALALGLLGAPAAETDDAPVAAAPWVDEAAHPEEIVLKARIVEVEFRLDGTTKERVMQAPIFSFDERWRRDLLVAAGPRSPLDVQARLNVERTTGGLWRVRGEFGGAPGRIGDRDVPVAWSQGIRTTIASRQRVTLAGLAPDAPVDAQAAIARGQRPERWSGCFVAYYLDAEVSPAPGKAPAK